MTSRERVLSAIAHKQPDQVPVDLSSTRSSGISAIAYSNLLKYIGRTDLPVRIYDVVQQLAQPDDDILKKFNIDVLAVGRTFDTQPSDWHETILSNGDKAYYPIWFNPVKQSDGSYHCYDTDEKLMLAKMPNNGIFFDQTYFPYIDGFPDNYDKLDEEMNRVVWGRYPSSPWDHAAESDFWKQLRKNAIRLRETTDKALMIICGCNLFEWGSYLRRMDNFLMDLLCEPDQVARMLDQLMERHLATLENVCKSVGDIVDIVVFGDDLGMTTGPFMDTSTYKTLFKPRLKQLCDYVKTHSKMHTFLHSCGSISSLMPDMIDAGIEIFNPVQTNALNMGPEFLKKEFGQDCTFWGGGIETAGTLNTGSTEQIRDQVLERMEIMSKGGGFVFNTVHNILPDVPPKNIIAMFDAIKEFNQSHKKISSL